MHTLPTDSFWLLLDHAVEVAHGDDLVKEIFLSAVLEEQALEEIHNFEIVFRQCVFEADDYKVMAAQKIITDYVSDDSYLYFRCWLIGQGQEVYTETLKNPDYLANIVHQGDMCSWEGLMYVATEAYSRKTDKEEDETFPRNMACELGLDYDLGPLRTKGTDWTYDQLPALLPKLWMKFH